MKIKKFILMVLCLTCSFSLNTSITIFAKEDLADLSIPLAEESSIVTFAFGGDMNFDENWSTMEYLRKQPNGILDCISPNLVAEMNAVDHCMINNEFTYSNRGKKTPGKMYTFRANPSHVDYLKQLGVDSVLLANNHVYDYGYDAFMDTLTTLEDAGISYIGAGRNSLDAMMPAYFTYGNLKVAYVAASRAEKYRLTPGATESSPGIFLCYDDTALLQVIANADKTSDLVIVNVHWGTEYSSRAEDYQRNMAYAMIDAGADAIIGSHTHVLQGMEFYQEKPIMYSLGNFWFNDKDLYTCLLELSYNKETAALENVRFIPCTQYDNYTNWPTDYKTQRKILDYESSISFGVSFDHEGYVISTK